MARGRRHPAVAGIDPQALAEFQAGIRRRYTDEEILRQLQECAQRLGRSPTMREFAADPGTSVHPQTVIEHFGSWNAAKRSAGLVPRRFATREELLGQLRALGEELGRTPTARDIDERKGRMPSKSLLWHTFGSLAAALREAGFDVPLGEERLERAVEQGAALARALGRLPKMADWAAARKEDASLLTEWQVYRMIDVQPAWAAFQFLVRERLVGDGDRREPLQARRALERRADGRQHRLLDVRVVRPEAGVLGDATVLEAEHRALLDLALAQAEAERVLQHLERRTRRGEEELARAGADPQRPADAAGEEEGGGDALVEPGGRHRAVELLERLGATLGVLREREDSLGVHRHLRVRADEAVAQEDLLVVDDDPVVDADDGTVPDRVVVGLDRRMALRVVADVDERLRRLEGHAQLVQERARAAAALVDGDRPARAAIRVADRVRAALSDAGEQGLSRERPVDAGLGAHAVAGNTTHFRGSS